MKDKDLKFITNRLEKLEKAVFNTRANRIEVMAFVEKKFSGATGGIRFLVTKGYFGAKRSLSDVKNKLAEEGYHYSVQAVQVALSRLSKVGGLLVTLKEDGRKKYVKRK